MRGWALRILAGVLSTTVLAAGAEAKPPDAAALGFSPERLQRLDRAVQDEIDRGRYAGLCLLVLRHDAVVKDGCYGYQDLATRRPMRRDAIFRIASMTKPVTGTALMILFEEGKWQLDDPIAKFAPEFAGLKVAGADGAVPLGHPITMRELLTSTAGFAAGHPIGSVNPAVDRQYAAARLEEGTLAEMAAKLAALPLESQPGTHFRYGIQHDIQAYLVERISGQSFDRFLEERLFHPLGMVDTGFGVAPEKRARIAPLYSYDAQMKLVPAANQGTRIASAHGTWFWIDPANDMEVIGMVQQEGAAAAHMGMPAKAPDLRALARSLIYAALVEPRR